MDIISGHTNIIGHLCDNIPITNRTYEIFLCMVNDDIIGYIIINLNSNNRYSIEHFYIKEIYRNSGLGEQLRKYCIDRYDKLTLIVAMTNHRAIHIYIKNGFEIIHSRKNYFSMSR